jgi:simple sugar transport system substrate-binding protein
VSPAARARADGIRAEMMKGSFVIFAGGRAGLKDNKGATVIAAGQSLAQTAPELERMGYLVEGVVGSIPG